MARPIIAYTSLCSTSCKAEEDSERFRETDGNYNGHDVYGGSGRGSDEAAASLTT